MSWPHAPPRTLAFPVDFGLEEIAHDDADQERMAGFDEPVACSQRAPARSGECASPIHDVLVAYRASFSGGSPRFPPARPAGALPSGGRTDFPPSHSAPQYSVNLNRPLPRLPHSAWSGASSQQWPAHGRDKSAKRRHPGKDVDLLAASPPVRRSGPGTRTGPPRRPNPRTSGSSFRPVALSGPQLASSILSSTPVPTCPSSPPAMPQAPAPRAPPPARAPCGRASFPRAHGFPTIARRPLISRYG